MNAAWKFIEPGFVLPQTDTLQTDAIGKDKYYSPNAQSTGNEPDGGTPFWQLPVAATNPKNFAVGTFAGTPTPFGLPYDQLDWLLMQVRVFKATCGLPCGDLIDQNDPTSAAYDATLDKWIVFPIDAPPTGGHKLAADVSHPDFNEALLTMAYFAHPVSGWPWSGGYNINGEFFSGYLFENQFWLPIYFTANGDTGGTDGGAWEAWTSDRDPSGVSTVGQLHILGQSTPLYGTNCAGDVTLTAKTLWTAF